MEQPYWSNLAQVSSQVLVQYLLVDLCLDLFSQCTCERALQLQSDFRPMALALIFSSMFRSNTCIREAGYAWVSFLHTLEFCLWAESTPESLLQAFVLIPWEAGKGCVTAGSEGLKVWSHRPCVLPLPVSNGWAESFKEFSGWTSPAWNRSSAKCSVTLPKIVSYGMVRKIPK